MLIVRPAKLGDLKSFIALARLAGPGIYVIGCVGHRT